MSFNLNKKGKVMNSKFESEMINVWGNNSNMIDFCTKKVDEIVELENGFIYVIEKPSIETSFCFGHGQFGISTDEEEQFASEKARQAKQFDAFKESNLKSAFGRYDRDLKYGKYFIFQYDKGQFIVTIIRSNDSLVDRFIESNKVVGELTENDKKAISEAFERSKKRFEKRLNTYWKRYGASKLKVWTYLVD